MEGAQVVLKCHPWTPPAAPVVSSWWKVTGLQVVLETVAATSGSRDAGAFKSLARLLLMTTRTVSVRVCACVCDYTEAAL